MITFSTSWTTDSSNFDYVNSFYEPSLEPFLNESSTTTNNKSESHSNSDEFINTFLTQEFTSNIESQVESANANESSNFEFLQNTSGTSFAIQMGQPALAETTSAQANITNRVFNIYCDVCLRPFKSQFDLKYHKDMTHFKKNLLQCSDCDRKCRSKNHLEEHRRIHTGEKLFKCDYCPKFFRQTSTRNEHIRAIHSTALVQCTLCASSFKHRVQLMFHIARLHPQVDWLPCQMCGKKFENLQTFEKHYEVCRNEFKLRGYHTTKRPRNKRQPTPSQ